MQPTPNVISAFYQWICDLQVFGLKLDTSADHDSWQLKRTCRRFVICWQCNCRP